MKNTGRIRNADLAEYVAELRGWHLIYMKSNMTLAGLGRMVGRSPTTLREAFIRHKLDLNRSRWHDTQTHAQRTAVGTFAAYIPATPAEIEEEVQAATRLMVPHRLRRDWRDWSLAERLSLMTKLRVKLGVPSTRPTGAYSANVVAFDYASERAHAMVAAANVGRDSRHRLADIKPTSEGVIWDDRLWFWNPPSGSYQHGSFLPGTRTRPQLQRVIYEQAHGVVLHSNLIVRYHDENRNNLDPANLYLVTRNDVVRENQAKALKARSQHHIDALLKLNQNTTANEQIINNIIAR